MTTPGKPVFGAGVLRYPAMQSPNYVAGASGWIIRQDGSVEFNNGTFRGTITAGTFQGNNFIINSSGQFFYSPTPGANNLVASIVPGNAGVTDPYGNVAFPGVTTYANAGGGLYFALQQATALAFNLWCTSDMTIGWTGASGVLSLTPQTSGGANPTFTRMTITLTGQVLSTGGNAASPTLITTDTWHPITLDAGLEAPVAGFAAPSYRLLPTGDLQLTGIANSGAVQAAGKNLNGSNPLPAQYRPATQKQFRSYSPVGPRGAAQLLTTGIIVMEFAAGAGGQYVELDMTLPLNL